MSPIASCAEKSRGQTAVMYVGGGFYVFGKAREYDEVTNTMIWEDISDEDVVKLRAILSARPPPEKVTI